MRQIIVKAVIFAFGLLCVTVVGLIVIVGDSGHYQELDDLAVRFQSAPSQQHLRGLMNYPADAASSYYKMALVGASFARHPTVFRSAANDFRTDAERENLMRLASAGVGVFEYHPELKPSDFEQRLEEQDWILLITSPK